jgi:hypothetical protein
MNGTSSYKRSTPKEFELTHSLDSTSGDYWSTEIAIAID